MSELLPCPFCGAKATMQKDGDTRGLYRVLCNRPSECKVRPDTYLFPTKAGAAAAWNTRMVTGSKGDQ